MPARHRTNPLALAVLLSLFERPMHPYEVATTLRQRQKHVSVRLNYGSLYAVVTSLERRGLVVAQGTDRTGRLPERTVYELTETGRVEMHDWLADLVALPVKEYPSFEAALSFLPGLHPDEVISLLRERAGHLEIQLAHEGAGRELVEKQGLPRLFWLEDQYRNALRQVELDFVQRLADDLEAGTLEGAAWWRSAYAALGDGEAPTLPAWTSDGAAAPADEH